MTLNIKFVLIKHLTILFCLSSFLLFNPDFSDAKDYTFSWAPNPDPVDGYNLYYKKGGAASAPFNGSDANEGPSPIDIGTETIFTITGLEKNQKYHFGLTAYYGSDESKLTPIVTVNPDPLEAIIANLNYGQEVPLIVEFDGSNSKGEIEYYFWEFGDGSTAYFANPTHIYTIPGSYTARLTVIDEYGGTDHTTILISATEPVSQPADPPTAVIRPTTLTGEAPFLVEFDGSSSTSSNLPLNSYFWDFGDGMIAEVESMVHTYTTPGIYNVTLVVSDALGEVGQTSTLNTVTPGESQLYESPVAVLTVSPSEGVPPVTVSYDASESYDPDGSIYQYRVDFGDGTISYNRKDKHKYSDSGIYTMTLTVVDNIGFTSSINTRISVLSGGGGSGSSAGKAIVPIIHMLLEEDSPQ